MKLNVPSSTDILTGQAITALADSEKAVMAALENPIGTVSLSKLVGSKNPKTVVITISDITRPVPNKLFLPPMVKILNACGIDNSQITIIVGTGMHRPSTPAEHLELVGQYILDNIEVIDHRADNADTLVKICNDPPVRVCRKFVEADFKIVTGFIEPHFMAGFSGGRKGVCPALVDLETVQIFHGYDTLAQSTANIGNLDDNPCHKIALKVAKTVGVDFLFNVSLTDNKELAGIYCGSLVDAHLAGCREVAKWMTTEIENDYDLVITSGGGYPLDQTFYQSVKGMCGALPALNKNSTLVLVSDCSQNIGSDAYTGIMLKYNNNWKLFLEDIKEHRDKTRLDQWQYQMQTRILELIGTEKLFFASDGIPLNIQSLLSITPVGGVGIAQKRAQNFIDNFTSNKPSTKIGVIPNGPYTILRKNFNSNIF